MWISRSDVFGELVDVYYVSSRYCGCVEFGSVEGCSQLFLAENRLKILRVDSGVVATSLFKVHIPVAGKCIRFGTELPRSEADDEVELGKEFRPLRLVAVQKLSCGEIFEIFVVGDDINGRRGNIKVVVTSAERFIDR